MCESAYNYLLGIVCVCVCVCVCMCVVGEGFWVLNVRACVCENASAVMHISNYVSYTSWMKVVSIVKLLIIIFNWTCNCFTVRFL